MCPFVLWVPGRYVCLLFWAWCGWNKGKTNKTDGARSQNVGVCLSMCVRICMWGPGQAGNNVRLLCLPLAGDVTWLGIRRCKAWKLHPRQCQSTFLLFLSFVAACEMLWSSCSIRRSKSSSNASYELVGEFECLASVQWWWCSTPSLSHIFGSKVNPKEKLCSTRLM